MKITLPLVSLLIDGAPPVEQRALFAGNVNGMGRIALELRLNGWTSLGRPTQLTVELSGDVK